jgi:hypothetical protein
MPDCMRGRSHWLLVVLLMTAAGCMDTSGSGPALDQTVAWDSAGVRIIESPRASLDKSLVWEVHPDPLVDIDGADDGSGAGFFRIGGVAELPDGRILVVDGSSRQLRFFAPTGRFLRAVGGEGDGPGEFRGRPQLVPAAGYDSLVVFDRSLQRFTAFSLDGEVRRTSPSLSLVATFVKVPWGEVPLSRITRPVGLLENRVVTLHTMGLDDPSASGLQPAEPAQFRMVDPTEASEQVVELLENVRWFTTAADELGQRIGFPVPFSVAPSGTVGREAFYLLRGGASEVRVYDAKGVVRKILRIDGISREIREQDLNAYIEARVATAPSAAVAETFQREYRHVPLPDLFPVFDEILVDSREWIWARMYQVGESRLRDWVIFDSDGRARGTIEVPGGVEIHQAGEDFLLGVWQDEWGVEHVQRLRLVRK